MPIAQIPGGVYIRDKNYGICKTLHINGNLANGAKTGSSRTLDHSFSPRKGLRP